MSSGGDVEVRSVESADHDAWARLFSAYRTFYRLEPNDEVLATVWSWIQDPDHELDALVAVIDGRVVGLAHHRPFARPLSGRVAFFLDDLFTDPEVRGRGVGRALVRELSARARAAGASMVRWLTEDDNATAQRLYDDVARRTTLVTYDLDLTRLTENPRGRGPADPADSAGAARHPGKGSPEG